MSERPRPGAVWVPSALLLVVYALVFVGACAQWMLAQPTIAERWDLAGTAVLLAVIALLPEPSIIDRGRVHAVPLVVIVAGMSVIAWPNYERLDANVAVLASFPALLLSGWQVWRRNRAAVSRWDAAAWRTAQLATGIVVMYAVSWALYLPSAQLPFGGAGIALAVGVTVTYVLSLLQHRTRLIVPMPGFSERRPPLLGPSRDTVLVELLSGSLLIVVPLGVITVFGSSFLYPLRMVLAVAAMVPAMVLVAWWTHYRRSTMATQARLAMYEARRQYMRDTGIGSAQAREWSVTADEERMVRLLLTGLRDGFLVTDAVVLVRPLLGRQQGNVYIAHDMDVVWRHQDVRFTREVLDPQAMRRFAEFADDNHIPIIELRVHSPTGEESVRVDLAAVPNSTDFAFRGLDTDIERFATDWADELYAVVAAWFLADGKLPSPPDALEPVLPVNDLPLYGMVMGLRTGVTGDEYLARLKDDYIDPNHPDATVPPAFAVHIRLNPALTGPEAPFHFGTTAPNVPKAAALAQAAANLTWAGFVPEPLIVSDGDRGLVVLGLDPYGLMDRRITTYRSMLTDFLQGGLSISEGSFGNAAVAKNFPRSETRTQVAHASIDPVPPFHIDDYVTIAVVRENSSDARLTTARDLIEAAQAETEAYATNSVVERTAITDKLLTDDEHADAFIAQFIPIIDTGDKTVRSYRIESYWEDLQGRWIEVPKLLTSVYDSHARLTLMSGAVNCVLSSTIAIRNTDDQFPLRVSIDHELLIRERLMGVIQSTLMQETLTLPTVEPLTVAIHQITHDVSALEKLLTDVADQTSQLQVAVAFARPDLFTPRVAQLPLVTEVILEPALVREWNQPVRAAEIRAIIDMARDHSLSVTALGVMRSSQYQDLTQWGVTRVELPATIDPLPLPQARKLIRRDDQGVPMAVLPNKTARRVAALVFDGSRLTAR